MSFKMRAVVAALMLSIAAPAAHAANLVINGDFSAGNQFFSSGYGYTPPTANALYPEGLYTVASNPNDVHNLWIALPEGDNKLIVNGATASTPVVWQEDNLLTVAGKTYNFSAQAANICCVAGFGGTNDPSTLLFQLSTDGGSTFNTIATLNTHPPTDAGVFQTATDSFVASGGPVSLRIIDQLKGQSGNDFAIDNISLAAVPEPASWALMMIGVGALGASLRSRRKMAIA